MSWPVCDQIQSNLPESRESGSMAFSDTLLRATDGTDGGLRQGDNIKLYLRYIFAMARVWATCYYVRPAVLYLIYPTIQLDHDINCNSDRINFRKILILYRVDKTTKNKLSNENQKKISYMICYNDKRMEFVRQMDVNENPTSNGDNIQRIKFINHDTNCPIFYPTVKLWVTSIYYCLWA